MLWLKKIGEVFNEFLALDNFKKKRPNVPVKVGDLQKWVVNRETQLISEQGFDSLAQNHLNMIKEWRWILECDLDERKKRYKSSGYVDLLDDGNKVFQDLTQFLDSLKCPKEIKFKEVQQFNILFKTNLEKLVKKFEKTNFSHNYSMILTDEEVNEVSFSMNPLLQELVNMAGKIEQFETETSAYSWTSLNKLKEQSNLIAEYHDQVKILREELKKREIRLGTIQSKVREKSESMGDLKNDKKYLAAHRTNKKKEELPQQISKMNTDLFLFFSEFKGVLSQFVYLDSVTDEDRMLARQYLEKSTVIFYDDKGLKVLDLFEKLEDAIKMQTLDVTPNEAIKLLQQIKKANEGYLKDLQTGHAELQTELDNLVAVKQDSTHINKIEETEYRLNHFQKQTKKMQNSIDNVKGDLNEVITLRNREVDNFQHLVLVTLQEPLQVILH